MQHVDELSVCWLAQLSCATGQSACLWHVGSGYVVKDAMHQVCISDLSAELVRFTAFDCLLGSVTDRGAVLFTPQLEKSLRYAPTRKLGGAIKVSCFALGA